MVQMFHPEPSIPPDLWTRLAWLDAHCDVQVARQTRSDGSGERIWRVTIAGRGRLDWPSITADAASLVDALRFAVLEAERRGWQFGWPVNSRAPGAYLPRNARPDPRAASKTDASGREAAGSGREERKPAGD